jgi:hypothetical protein
MSLTRRKSEPQSPANGTCEDMTQNSAYPAGRHWLQATLSKYDHKSWNERAVLPGAGEDDRREESFRIAGRSAA